MFTLDKKSVLLLAGCLVAAAILLFVAGFLLGIGQGESVISKVQRGLKVQDQPVSDKTFASGKSGIEANHAQQVRAKKSTSNAQKISPAAVSGEVRHETNLAATNVRGSHFYCLQFGLFQRKKNADIWVQRLKHKKVVAREIVFRDATGHTLYGVRSGRYVSVDAASAEAAMLRRKLKINSHVRRVGEI